MPLIVPEVISHRIEESESIEIKTRWHNFEIKIKSTSPSRVKEMADEMTRLLSLSTMVQDVVPTSSGASNATGDSMNKVSLRARGA